MLSQMGKMAERALHALFVEEYPFLDSNMYVLQTRYARISKKTWELQSSMGLEFVVLLI